MTTVSAGLGAREDCEGASAPRLLPSRWWSAFSPWGFWACMCITLTSVVIATWHFPVCVCVQISPFIKTVILD